MREKIWVSQAVMVGAYFLRCQQSETKIASPKRERDVDGWREGGREERRDQSAGEKAEFLTVLFSLEREKDGACFLLNRQVLDR